MNLLSRIGAGAALSVAGLLVLSACGSSNGSGGTTASAGSSASAASNPSAGSNASASSVGSVDTGSSQAAEPLQKVSFSLEYQASGYQAPYSLAIEKGWFKDAGLDLSMKLGSGSAATITEVATGKIDIGLADFATFVIAREKGIPVKAVSGVFAKGMLSIATHPDEMVKTPKDLKGKSIAITTGGQDSQLLPPFLEANGLTANDVKVVNVSSAAKTSSFLAKKVDAFMPAVCGSAKVVEIGQDTPMNFLPLADYGLNVLGLGIVSNDSVIKDHPDWIKAFNKVTAKAWAYSEKHPDEAVAAAVKRFPDLKPKIAIAQLKCSFDYLQSPNDKGHPFGWMSPKDWTSTISTIGKAADVKTYPAGKYYTNQFTAQS